MAQKREKKEEISLEEEVVKDEDTDVEEAEVAKDEVDEETDQSEDVDGEAGQSEEPKAKIEITPLFLAREEAEMYKDRWMRLAAEFENYKKRRAREFEALVKSASEDVIRDLLPILDGVGRALAHSENGDTESEGFQEGIKMIMEQFPRVLYNRNLKEIETVGKPFDPTVHEALMQMPSDIHDAGIVADEVEKGYSLGDKVLRPAKVVVSQGKPEPEIPEGDADTDES